MRLNRIFLPVIGGGARDVPLDEAQSRYLTRVLRLREGDSVLAFCGDGSDYPGILRRTTSQWSLELGEAQEAPAAELAVQVHLLQALVRPDKFELVVQKATELGAASITPVVTIRCERKPGKTAASPAVAQRNRGQRKGRQRRVPDDAQSSNIEAGFKSGEADSGRSGWQGRLDAIASSAAGQSGRGRVPTIAAPLRFHDALSLHESQPGAGSAPLRLLLDPSADQRLAAVIIAASPALAESSAGWMPAIVITVGPEGGFSDRELAAARLAGFVAVSLGTPILRTETAALAAIAQIAALLPASGT